MKVAVKTFGNLRRFLPDQRQGEWVELASGATVLDLLGFLGIPENEAWRVSCNGALVSLNHSLSDGDQVSIFAPVGGG